MARPKEFKREELLRKVIPLFWKKGFADTSLSELERVSGVNKSGLYSEFSDKNDLFLESLSFYLKNNGVKELLAREPLGVANVREFLRMSKSGPGPRGCFAVNCLRESAVIPKKAGGLIADHLTQVQRLLRNNIETIASKQRAASLSDMILTFNAGLCLESSFAELVSVDSKIDKFLNLLFSERS